MASSSKKVYLDASIFCSFIDRVHSRHDQAAAYFRYFGQSQYVLFTDSNMVMHAYDTIYKDVSPALAKDFLRILSVSNINFIYPDESDHKAALKALTMYQSLELTYSQALMAVLAQRRGIPQICTFDYLHNLFGLSVFYIPL